MCNYDIIFQAYAGKPDILAKKDPLCVKNLKQEENYGKNKRGTL